MCFLEKEKSMEIGEKLEILYQDDYVVAVNKPHGYMVHRSSIARNATLFVLQILRDQIQKKVFPIHRLDRKTSGVLLFALDTETNRHLGAQFADRKVSKEYKAIVRGWTENHGVVDYALTNDKGKVQDAITEYWTLRRSEIDLPLGRFDTSRYSEILVKPKTGRMHQIRKHLNHLRHPILGDRPHGCSKQNRLWKNNFGITTMTLHAQSLSFIHPHSNELITIEADHFIEYEKVLGFSGLSDQNQSGVSLPLSPL